MYLLKSDRYLKGPRPKKLCRVCPPMFTAAAPVGAVSTHSRFLAAHSSRIFFTTRDFPTPAGPDMNTFFPARTLSTASCWRAFSDGDDLEEGSSSERPAKLNLMSIISSSASLPSPPPPPAEEDVEGSGSGAPALRALVAILSRAAFLFLSILRRCASVSPGEGHGCSDGSIRRLCGGDGGPGGALSAARTLLTR